MEMVEGIVEQFVDMRCPDDKHPDTWDLATLRNDVLTQFGGRVDIAAMNNLNRQEMTDYVFDRLQQKYQEKEDLIGSDVMRQTERIIMLQVIDNQWKDHLLSMDELKQGIGNRAYGQKDPLVEYKKESYELFTAMMDRIEDETVRYLYFLQVTHGSGPALPFPTDDEDLDGDGNGSSQAGSAQAEPAEPTEEQRTAAQSSVMDFTRNIERRKEKELAALTFGGDDSSGPKQVMAGQKVGRN